ncbi:MAG: Nif3-like dinuclear metal center hexameric protein [Deinococcota bacterium]|nr:Nif3-like dinuclear metal center hexameric protein [Deinococcota bacterium]
MITLAETGSFLDGFFGVALYRNEPDGSYLPSQRPIRRLGLALEPFPGLGEWVRGERLDALFLHRPWGLEKTQPPPDVGVLAYHLPFDETLTLGMNARLAGVLSMTGLMPLGKKDGRVIGMLGDVPNSGFQNFRAVVEGVFGGLETVVTGRGEVARVAVVGAMTEALVLEAAERGADVYITGQFRQPAERAVLATGIAVIEVGHERSERWGLRALAGVLRERWAGLEVIVYSRS